jgi:hypothetical protein
LTHLSARQLYPGFLCRFLQRIQCLDDLFLAQLDEEEEGEEAGDE